MRQLSVIEQAIFEVMVPATFHSTARVKHLLKQERGIIVSSKQVKEPLKSLRRLGLIDGRATDPGSWRFPYQSPIWTEPRVSLI